MAARQASGSLPPAGAMPIRSIVGPQRQRLVDAGHHRHVGVEAGDVVAHA